MNQLLAIVILSSLTFLAIGQPQIRLFPNYINHPGRNNIAPYISLDGNSMVYLNDSGEDNEFIGVFTSRRGVDWTDPSELPASINSKLNFIGGFTLNQEGKTLYFSSRKSNGVGEYDIYYSLRNGLSWGAPANLGLPINSKINDASPSISLDGNTMYFMRCGKMDNRKAEDCKIFSVQKKPNGKWDEPAELPPIINTGNSQTPRILGDNKSLIFSSDKISPNKGGMDLYMSKLENGKWGKPVALDFINTSGNEQYVSASWLGRYMTIDLKEKNKYSLAEVLFPDKIRPNLVTKIEGTVTGMSNTQSAYISVINVADRKIVFSTRTDRNGKFTAYSEKGNVYKLSIDPEQGNYTFSSKFYDFTGEKTPILDKLSAIIKPAEVNDEIILEEVVIDSVYSQLGPNCPFELRRVQRLIEANMDKSFVIEVTHKKDIEPQFEEKTSPIDIDSLAQTKLDSVGANNENLDLETIAPQESEATMQAKLIVDYLYHQGIDSLRLSAKGYISSDSLPDNKNILVKIIVH